MDVRGTSVGGWLKFKTLRGRIFLKMLKTFPYRYWTDGWVAIHNFLNVENDTKSYIFQENNYFD